ncbi:hypothetical protein R3P38DRAFT_3450139 [Favolaschia claudopus]|uniref:Uncharacterized protein n=1 Tax=Favolaschia claudopus TaxID=2862362 RepID=A0AAV9ZMA1_9AGAR
MRGVPESDPNQQNRQVNSLTIGVKPNHDVVVGATGGIGEGPRFQAKTVWLDKADLIRIDKISTKDFCAEYQLDDDVRDRLEEEGVLTIISLFYENEEGLKSWGFNIGSIAEIRAALKRRLADKHPDIMVVTPRTTNDLDIGGGVGGAGGFGEILGGMGGTGKAGSFDLNQMLAAATGARFRGKSSSKHATYMISSWKPSFTGGIGGAAGATSSPGPRATNMPRSPTTSPRAGTLPDIDIKMDEVDVVQQGFVVEGGVGGAGGWAAKMGGTGGEGQGPHIPMLYVSLFRKIRGGTGGIGGDATEYGGRGGDGAAPSLANRILAISEDTRRKIPRTPLEDVDLAAPLLKLLKDNGFRTVGGLLELNTEDLVGVAGWKRGYPRVLEAELDRFRSRYEQ